MNFFINSFRALLIFSIFSIKFILCIISDTVLSDSWDDCEAFHADFSSSDEMSDECVILENQSMIYEPDQSDESPSAMQTEILGETHFIPASPLLINNSNQLEELLRGMQNKEPEETSIETTIPHYPRPLSQSESTNPLMIDDSNEWEELISEFQYEVPEGTLIDTTIPHHPPPSNQRESTSEIHNNTETTEPEKKVIYRGHKFSLRFVTIGSRSRRAWGKTTIFKDHVPGISIAHKLSQEQMEIILHSFGDVHQWDELRQYPIQNCYGYWANVCDYFWVKTPPNNELFRGCYVGTRVFPHSRAHIVYMHGEMCGKSVKLEILRCQCHFYGHDITLPNSTISKFAVHKYRESEYFVLKEIGPKNCYTITDFLTQVYLPNPQNNSMIQESDQLVESRHEQQNDTEMVVAIAHEPPHRNLPRVKFFKIGDESKIEPRLLTSFNNLIPGKSNRQNVSQEQLEIEFVSQKNKPPWTELKEYSLDKYLGYWGSVCDYFWKKPTPDDKRFRACLIRTSFYPYTLVRVILSHISNSNASRKLEVLQCQCYYYVKYQKEPDSNQTNMAIHKHRDNEFFLLDKVPGTKYRYKITDLITEVYLPDPVN